MSATFRDLGRRPVDFVEELGMAMELAPPGDDVIMEFGEAINDRHRLSSAPAKNGHSEAGAGARIRQFRPERSARIRRFVELLRMNHGNDI
jgi:hypothetical protein